MRKATQSGRLVPELRDNASEETGTLTTREGVDRKLQGYRLLQQGMTQREVAQLLGITQSAISHWVRKVKEEGEESLLVQKNRGPKERLTAEQKAELLSLLQQGAEQCGFAGNYWTRPRVCAMIKSRFGVSLGARQVSRILHKMGYRLNGQELEILPIR